MIFEHLTIQNFRNFEEASIDLTNRNIVFGLNDIGKSNFLSAIRFLLDRNYRRNGFMDSDFYDKDTGKEIAITLRINIAEEENDDNKKIYTMMGGSIPSDVKEVYIQLKSTYDDETLLGEPNLYWGADLEELEEVPSSQTFYDLDKFFNVVYIDSSIQLENTFKRYSKEILKDESSLSDVERTKLGNNINRLNKNVSQLSAIKSFKKELVKEYKKFKDERNFNVSIQSEIELSNIHDKLRPYIQDERHENYPTSGDGRKKILAYTLFTLENRRLEDRKINIFLIEELENHLHRSMQISLSYQIFSDKLFKYLFMTTHSSLIVSQMDNANLIKLFKENTQIIGRSYVYKVPEKYKTLKQKLNQNLAEAIYADVVLLVEGPSEKTLFERILNEKCERYESFGGYILEVDGINFSEYYKVLTELGIKVIVKTDNDLKKVNSRPKCNLIGVNRCQRLIERKEFPSKDIDTNRFENDSNYKIEQKRFIYSKLNGTIKRLERNHIYLSEVDLENDLYEVIPRAMDRLARRNNSSKNGVDFLQNAKLINMIDLCTDLSKHTITKVYNNERFKCLKVLVELCCR
ncbi:ATP-dependent nuclease [Lentibacillus sediminis]|uniref:ATP-dependent nuclease n=1 Tax=Lentibacillus sediminis TaxID=1940529 RepID=UPI000C1C49B8|nr:AAA family ATPase [Lentibacillus sediminis]